jgi:hypothetical protein
MPRSKNHTLQPAIHFSPLGSNTFLSILFFSHFRPLFDRPSFTPTQNQEKTTHLYCLFWTLCFQAANRGKRFCTEKDCKHFSNSVYWCLSCFSNHETYKLHQLSDHHAGPSGCAVYGLSLPGLWIRIPLGAWMFPSCEVTKLKISWNLFHILWAQWG